MVMAGLQEGEAGGFRGHRRGALGAIPVRKSLVLTAVEGCRAELISSVRAVDIETDSRDEIGRAHV